MHNFCNKELEYYKIFEMHQTFYKIITHKYFILFSFSVFVIPFGFVMRNSRHKSQEAKKINVVNKKMFCELDRWLKHSAFYTSMKIRV